MATKFLLVVLIGALACTSTARRIETVKRGGADMEPTHWPGHHHHLPHFRGGVGGGGGIGHVPGGGLGSGAAAGGGGAGGGGGKAGSGRNGGGGGEGGAAGRVGFAAGLLP